MIDPSPAGRSPRSPLVLGLALSQLIGWGTLYYPFALLVEPMEADIGWSRADLNGALTAGMAATALATLPVGHWIDRHGGRGMMTAGALLGAAMLVLWGVVGTLPVFYALWIGIGLAQAMSLGDPAYTVITANVPAYRRALIYLTFISALSITCSMPLTQLLVAQFGWRQALFGLAVVQLLGPVLINATVLRGTRGSRSDESATVATDKGSPVRAALRRSAFWALTLCFSAYAFTAMAVTFHFVGMMREVGHSLDSIVTALALHGPAQLAGRLLLFFVGREASARRIGLVTMPIVPAAMLMLIFVAPRGFGGLMAYALVYGLSVGVLTVVRAASIAEILGTRGYGAISGAMNTVTLTARTASPLAIALMWSVFGGYGPVLWILLGLSLLAVAAFWYAVLADPSADDRRVV